MNPGRYGRTLAIGVAVLVGSLFTARAIHRAEPPIEPTPAEQWLAAAAMAPEEPDAIRWDLPLTSNDRVRYWIDFLKGRNYDKTRLWLERSGRYAPMIRERLRERGMPEDLIYLALIESGFSPRAYSRARAAGIWQFIAETGRRYGLEVSEYVDERRDPIKATDAALDYLEELYGRFGSWYLAAAAYNSGENRVERILRQRAGGARGRDSLFWAIAPYLPRETRDYVPLMLAAGHIAKEPAKYGFHDLKYQAPLRFEEVTVPGGTDLPAIARAAAADPADLRDLNPHLVRSVTPPGRKWAVRLPSGGRAVFARNFDRVRAESRFASIEHTVGRGETLSHIARRYGTTVGTLRAANGGVDPRRIRVGQRIRVPMDMHLASMTPGASNRVAAEWTVYRVRRGDSLWSISRRHGVTVAQLQQWNSLGRRSRIIPGQRLRIQG